MYPLNWPFSCRQYAMFFCYFFYSLNNDLCTWLVLWSFLPYIFVQNYILTFWQHTRHILQIPTFPHGTLFFAILMRFCIFIIFCSTKFFPVFKMFRSLSAVNCLYKIVFLLTRKIQKQTLDVNEFHLSKSIHQNIVTCIWFACQAHHLHRLKRAATTTKMSTQKLKWKFVIA